MRWRLAAVFVLCALGAAAWISRHHHYDVTDAPHLDGQAPHYDKASHYDAPPGGWVTLFDLPLSSNGVTGVDDLPSTIPEPTVAWFGFDPLVNHGSAGGTFSASGTPSASQTPFCHDGDYSDLSDTGNPATKSCMQARFITGVSHYASDTASLANPGTSDYSICAVYKRSSTGNQGIAGCRNPVGNNGVALSYTGGSTYFIWESDTAVKTESVVTSGLGGWAIACGTGDYDGNIYLYVNGVDGGATASVGGDLSAGDTGFKIGNVAASGNLTGDIAAVYAWPGVALTADQVKAFTWHWMGLLPSSAGSITTSPTTVTTAGDTCCWTDSTTPKLECFADDWIPIGCLAAPPGLTGATTSDGGMMAIRQQTNNAIRSNDFSAGWTEVGTVVGATSTAASPFRDAAYHPVYLLEDNDAGAAEYVTQVIDITALNTNHPINIVVFARSDSGTKGIDIRASEQTGAGCTAKDNDFTAEAITTTWTTIDYTFNLGDGDCTELLLQIGPVSDAGDSMFDVAETGAMYAIVQVLFYQAVTPNAYIETAASAANGCGTLPVWTNSMAALTPGASDRDEYTIVLTPGSSAPHYTIANTSVLWVLTTDGGFADYMYLYLLADGSASFIQQSGANTLSIAAPGFAGGTATTFTVDMDWGSDTYLLYQDNALKDSGTTADSPPVAIDTLAVGTSTSVTARLNAAQVKNFKVRRKR